jgi:hypothetical protein
MKKEFTAPRPLGFDKLSDIELIEVLDRGTSTPSEIDVIKAILDKRTKITIQDLKNAIVSLNNKSSRYSMILIILTVVLAILAAIQIFLLFR